MYLHGLIALLRESAAFQTLLQQVQAGCAIPDQGIVRAARPFVVAALAQATGRPLVVLSGTVERAYTLTEQLPVWLPETPIYRFAEPSALFYDRSTWTSSAIRGRLTALSALMPPLGAARGAPPIVVASAHALMQRTLPPREFRAHSRQLSVGQRVDQEKLLRLWLAIGYTPTSVVTEAGTFSRRGGVLDIFPISAERPVRIELFGDEIESLRAFDPSTQRSLATLERVSITPAREVLPKFAAPVALRLADWFAAQPEPLDRRADSPRADQGSLASETAFPYLEFYLPYCYREPSSLLDYLPEDALLIVEDWRTLEETVAALEAQAVDLRAEKERLGQLPPDYPLPYLTWEALRDSIVARVPVRLGGYEEQTVDPETLGALFAPEARYGGQLRPFLEALRDFYTGGTRAVIVSNQAQRLAELWTGQGHTVRPSVVTTLSDVPDLAFVEGALAEGWQLRVQPTLHLLTDAEIFGWRRPEPRRQSVLRAVSPEAHFADLQPNDYVVHSDYGIARFLGLHKLMVDGSQREYLALQFSGTDMLYVPIHQADRVSRYVGIDDQPPSLTRLGSSEWHTRKEAAQRAAEETAREMLELYAKRAVAKGHAFSPDTAWQAELEASFPYIETDDQLRALAEVKADMERPIPMDRLLCGDVGFGKTEVALRAAFKAVMDGKQVALLVPTTVLAQQHFNTFSQRLAAFPVKVEMLSRFRTPREQSAILEATRRGEIDILIGTHRLLSDDVIFKDLGLLIIDEEQRFGVTHKERFKRLRTEIDVLTMTATPIPRTLYMSLSGIRDISMIQTPPAERLPVITHIGPYDEQLVRQAILRELDRGGQVYFVHNRVATIRTVADHLRRLVPEARLAIGHGQMPEEELERVMIGFANGEQDILLCTTIIENGLDIPSANTIIVDRADTLGLAQLYQLRGRVGRGAYRAYAYLFYAQGAVLTADARARLETVAEHTDLGSGYSIAMRDLELRGAGELLGSRQSGFIASVGFHLYTQMLAESVARLKREQPTPKVMEVSEKTPLVIDLPLRAYVPAEFIAESAMRLQLYRRLADTRTPAQLDDMRAELQDRFGNLPPELDDLLYQLRVKLLAQAANVQAITLEAGQIALKLPYLGEIDRMALQRYLGNEVRVSRVAIWLPHDANGKWRLRLLDILQRLQPIKHGRVRAAV
ncbi:MAG: transcription-repair coupling factor [Anaerolineae bacterium]|nr:transcription-repair coupling factor [Anaerolineae bacterium]